MTPNQGMRKLANICLETGYKAIQSAFHLTPKKYTRQQMRDFLVSVGLTGSGAISLADENYYVEKWEAWKQLIEVDWTEAKAWYKDFYDCDNHAFTFTSRISELFNLNTAGVCFGNVYREDKTLIDAHAFNLIVAENETGELAAYLLEPLTDKYVEWDKNGNNILGTWEYKINWVIMY